MCATGESPHHESRCDVREGLRLARVLDLSSVLGSLSFVGWLPGIRWVRTFVSSSPLELRIN